MAVGRIQVARQCQDKFCGLHREVSTYTVRYIHTQHDIGGTNTWQLQIHPVHKTLCDMSNNTLTEFPTVGQHPRHSRTHTYSSYLKTSQAKMNPHGFDHQGG